MSYRRKRELLGGEKMSTVTLVKKDLILGGLACAHCAEEIGEAVKKIKGIENSNYN